MSFKRLFSRALSAQPQRLHMAAHSHHLWPDASLEGQLQCWEDAARLADAKWDKVMGEVWPEAQRHVASELATGMPEAIVFASNTHELLVRLVAAAPRSGPLRVLTSSGEFHSARRQFSRWVESGDLVVTDVPTEPFATFGSRFIEAAATGHHDLIFVSQVMFNCGLVVDGIDQVARLGRPEGPWVVIDGYHAFMALDEPFGREAAKTAFYLGGGYKYAMAGEGCAFMHAPPGFGLRPPITGWYAEFDDLSLPPGQVGYAPDAQRFMGATFDASGLYRFNAVRRMLDAEGLDTAAVTSHVKSLQRQLIAALGDTPVGTAELLNPDHRGRFIALRSPDAASWCASLKSQFCITDVRGDVLRIGLGLYHDAEDVHRLIGLTSRWP